MEMKMFAIPLPILAQFPDDAWVKTLACRICNLRCSWDRNFHYGHNGLRALLSSDRHLDELALSIVAPNRANWMRFVHVREGSAYSCNDITTWRSDGFFLYFFLFLRLSPFLSHFLFLLFCSNPYLFLHFTYRIPLILLSFLFFPVFLSLFLSIISLLPS